MAWLLILGLIGLAVVIWELEAIASRLELIRTQPANEQRLSKEVSELAWALRQATEQLNLIESNTFGLSAGIKSVERAVLEGNRPTRTGL